MKKKSNLRSKKYADKCTAVPLRRILHQMLKNLYSGLLLFRLVLVLYFIGFILGNNSEVEKCAVMMANGTGVLIENYIYVVNDFCYSTEIYLCNWNFVTQGLWSNCKNKGDSYVLAQNDLKGDIKYSFGPSAGAATCQNWLTQLE